MVNSEYMQNIRTKVMQTIDLSGDIEDDQVRCVIDMCILEYSLEKPLSVRDKVEIKRDLFNSLRRLDVLSDMLDDDSITEIMINGADNIFIERAGRLCRYDRTFESEERLKSVIQHIVAECNRLVNESFPIVDARLKDGSRVNVVLPPVSLGGCVMTIRKFPKEGMTMERLLQLGSITTEVAEFLRKLVVSGYNIIVSGGTGAGKTTFLNALSGYIPHDERIVTIEDSAELQLTGIDNLVSLESRSANVEGENAVSIRDLIKTSLRMRPSRIIVGEVRDAAAIDMLTAIICTI